MLTEELGHYQAQHKERLVRERLFSAAKARGTQLEATRQELKQARTQLFLHEEGPALVRTRLSPRVRGLQMVVVDEHPGVRELLVTTLKKAGIPKVEGAPGSQAALDMIRSTPMVEVVLSEWDLADMDGLALFRAVRAQESPSAKAVFILLTTRENREAVEEALQAGVDGYLLKPFHVQTLVERVEELYNKRHREHLERRIQAEVRPLSIIVANIDLDSRMEIQQLLTGAGVQNVAIADSGQKALRWIREKRPDVVIYDCNVRDPYWLDLEMALLREDPHGAVPPLIVTSVAPMQKEYEDVYNAGLGTFLPGPVHRRELFQTILRARELQPR